MFAKIALVFMAATPAMAVCPVGADLTGGIRIVQDDGTVEVFRTLRPGVVEMTNAYEDDYASRTLLGQGIYVLEFADIIDGSIDSETRVSFAFSSIADELPVPEPGDRWNTRTVVRDVDGTYPEKLRTQWGDEITVDYGACSYRMIPGTLSYASDVYSHEEVVHYLPDLGFAVLYSYFDDEMAEPDVYRVTDISKAKD